MPDVLLVQVVMEDAQRVVRVDVKVDVKDVMVDVKDLATDARVV